MTTYATSLWALRFLLAVTTVLSFFHIIDFVWWHILSDMVLFLFFCWASNWMFAKIFGVVPNPESQYITGEILTLIVGPLDPFRNWQIILVISVLAMASKYLLVWKKQHIFNPTGFAIFAAAILIGQGASWWVGGIWTNAFVAIAGLMVIRKLKWFHLLWSFLLTYFVLLAITLFNQGMESTIILESLKISLFSSSLIFFATIMLVEPLTAPNTKNLRIIYGAFVAAVMVLHAAYWPIEWFTYGYSIETALLIGNIFAFAVSKRIERQNLKFISKKLEAKDTYSFWFQPTKKFNFIAGQYLEWALPHKNYDSRGIRRFFTISSSPDQNRVRLITKFYPNPSTFKQALMKLQPGDEVSVSRLDGEFTLPNAGNRPLVFIAGGVGIAPFLSMIEGMKASGEKHDITLFYANKTDDEVAFKEFLNQATNSGVKIVNIITEKEGFLTPEKIQKETPKWKDSAYFISGPEPLVINYISLLKKMGIPGKQIHRDYFPGYDA